VVKTDVSEEPDSSFFSACAVKGEGWTAKALQVAGGFIKLLRSAENIYQYLDLHPHRCENAESLPSTQ
jgi:hypothetical protein